MDRIKTLFVVFFGLFLAGIPVHAQLLGIPDDAPARRIIVPFFNLDKEGTDDFLVTVVNTFNQDVAVHAIVYDRDTNHAYDFNLSLTAGDVEGFSVRTLINGMPEGSRRQLLLEEGGRTLYRGEIRIDVNVLDPGDDGSEPFGGTRGNVLVCYIYWIDVSRGALSEFNALHVQYGTVAELFRDSGAGNRLTDEDGFEVFTADALRDIEDAIYLGSVIHAGPNGLDFYIRYFIPDTQGSDATLIVWSDTADENYGLTLLAYDEDENVVSTFISAPHQVNLFEMSQTIPAGFINSEGHKAGWILVRSDGRAIMMWMRERMIGPDGSVLDGVRRVPRALVYP